ncbi:MAG: LuxR C-terminal-related transcriptional regulator [Sideroxydans sp.]|nr:LuxR C-terminal-related transcriptional regulator [Sideroxydans sp.]
MTLPQQNNELTALVVDDDIALSKAVNRIGREEGFCTRCFTSCDDAHAWLKQVGDAPRTFCMLVSISQLAAIDRGDAALVAHVPRIYIGSSLTGAQAGLAGLGTLLKAEPFRVMDRPFSMALLRANLRDALAEQWRLNGLLTDRQQLLQRFSELTRRQMQIGSQVVQGLSNPEIAEKLGISVKTVKTHRGMMMKKTGANSIADLVRLFDAYQEMVAKGSAGE